MKIKLLLALKTLLIGSAAMASGLTPLDVQKAIAQNPGSAWSKNTCIGYTSGQTLGKVTYAPKQVVMTFCDLSSMGAEGEGAPTLLAPCNSNPGEVMYVEVNDREGNNLGFGRFWSDDVREQSMSEAGTVLMVSDDADRIITFKTSGILDPNHDNTVLRVEGIAGEDTKKTQEVHNFSCDLDEERQIPAVDSSWINNAVIAETGGESDLYFVKTDGKNVYLEDNGNSVIYNQVRKNVGQSFNIKGKVYGSSAQGFAMLVEEMVMIVDPKAKGPR